MARAGTTRRIAGPGLTLTAVLTLGFIVAGCGSPPAAEPSGTPEPAVVSIPVIIDSDFGIDDLAAITILLRDPQVDVQAITIEGTGIAHCKTGRLMARYLLDQLGSTDIPIGCGREEAGPDGHVFPAAWRAAADSFFGLDIAPTTESGQLTAVAVIQEAIAHSPSAPTVVALGPWTNLEDAFAADTTLADHLAAVHAMLGSIRAPGNVTIDGHTPADHLEWNAFADPSAVTKVLDTDVPIALVPLDATDDVPVPSGLVQRLADVHAAGADLVHELLVRNPSRMDQDTEQLWDELAALALTNRDLVDWTDATVTVDPFGRLVQDDAGQSVRFADAAHRTAVGDALVEALGRGAPRATPFQLSGTVGVTFDGAHCTASGHSDREGPHQVDFKSSTGKPAGATLVGATGGHTWQDVVDLIQTIDVQASPPSWLVDGPTAQDTAGDGTAVTATGSLRDGFYGPICFSGAFPDLTFVAGTPFEVGSGAIGS